MEWWNAGLIGLFIGAAAGIAVVALLMSTRSKLARDAYNSRQVQLGYQFLRIEILTTRLELQIKSLGRDFGLSIKFGEVDPWEQIHDSLRIIKDNLELSAEELSFMRAKIRKELDSFTPERIEDTKTL